MPINLSLLILLNVNDIKINIMKQIFTVQFLGAFAKLRKWTNPFVICVRPPVLPHEKTRLPPDGFS